MGQGKIIQEVRRELWGPGWKVIKVIGGNGWDTVLGRDKNGLLKKRMMEAVDGEYQTFKSKDGAYVRKYFFGKCPELLDLVADWTDDEIWHLNRGGLDTFKVYAAYQAAVEHKGQPTVILAKTIKGFGMGVSGEAQKGGAEPAATPALVRSCRELDLEVEGLMAVGATGGAEMARPGFMGLRAMADDLSLREGAMGVGGDWGVGTEAERGCLAIIDISPKKAPGLRIFRMSSRPSSSPMKTCTLPAWIM